MVRLHRLLGVRVVLLALVAAAAGVMLHAAARQRELDLRLLRAVEGRNQAAALKTLREGADPNMRASRREGDSILRYLLDLLMRRPHVCKRGAPVLLLAASKGEHDLVRALLDRGANEVNGVLDDGTTALLAEADAGRIDTVSRLLRKGARPDGDPHAHITPLGTAARGGNIEMMRALLDSGAKADGRTVYVGTPVIAAADSMNVDAVRLLLARGASPKAEGGVYGTALVAVAFNEADPYTTAADRRKVHEIVRMLLARGVNPDHTNLHHGNTTALCAAAESGDRWMLDALLRAHASTNTGLTYGTPLMTAAHSGDLWMVNRLLAVGANVNAHRDKWGETALIDAAYAGQAAAARVLLAHGARIDDTDDRGGTALTTAAAEAHSAVVRLLLAHGADPDPARDDDADEPGGTALSLAVHNGHADVARLLRRAGAR